MSFFILTSTILTFGQNTLSGRIISNDGDPLPFANIVVTHTIENGIEVPLKSQKGTTSDIEGYYTLTALPDALLNVKVIYVGYKEITLKVDFSGEVRELTKDVELSSGSVDLEEVVVTSQAKGQMAAINQQLSSNTIKNVVAADRIRQNTDTNAAESIGRLSGVSVTRKMV